MTRSRAIKSLAFVVLSVTYTQCWISSKPNAITVGGVAYGGKGLTDPEDAVGFTYKACTTWCGSGQEPFDWPAFSQQFSAWLLPWLALVCQLPFSAENNLDNLISSTFTSRDYQYFLLILLPCTSRSHYRVPRPRSIFPRSHSPQHSLGLQAFLGH